MTILLLMLTGVLSANDHRLVVAQGGLRLRASPDMSSPVLMVIPDGSTVEFIMESDPPVTIAGKAGKWTRIRFQSLEGWVFGGFLTKAGTKAALNSISGQWCFFRTPRPAPNPDPRAPGPMWTHRISFRATGQCRLEFNTGHGFDQYECEFETIEDRINLTNSNGFGVVLHRRPGSLEWAEKSGRWDLNLGPNLIGVPCLEG